VLSKPSAVDLTLHLTQGISLHKPILCISGFPDGCGLPLADAIFQPNIIMYFPFQIYSTNIKSSVTEGSAVEKISIQTKIYDSF